MPVRQMHNKNEERIMDTQKISIIIVVPTYCILFLYSLLAKNYYAAHIMLSFALAFPIIVNKLCEYLLEEDGSIE